MIGEARELLKANDLSGALDALQSAVRSDPADAKLRIFLFQLLCVMGDWKRAITQLKLCAEMEEAAVPMAQTYREGIICEVYREKVFSGEKDPLIFGEPPEWMALMIEALKAQAAGKVEEAAAMRARAFDAVPDMPGEINGERFEWIADADMRMGPILEVVVNGKYFWMPFSAILSLRVEPPEDLRDAVWSAANLTLQNGGEFVALIPTRYAGTSETGSDAEKLARATSWVDAGSDTFVGMGQRLLTTDKSDFALMDLRNLQMDPVLVSEGSDDG